ncbi:MAG: antibiotic biosynthesis monooxygenase [Roseinatronobacter sp.]|nr:antibiotic biosynthesis monooxygenase [Roseinatronobacter sp.]
MHALFFEVRPKQGHLRHYFEHVDILKPVLAQHAGLIFLDRYASLADRDVLLSHQFWENDAAIAAWRKDSLHRRSQTAGRSVHFEDYRIRVAERVLHVRAGQDMPQAVPDMTPSANTRYVVAAYGNRELQHPDFTGFQSVNTAASYIALAEAQTIQGASALIAAIAPSPGFAEAYAFRVLRDYGMHDRAEAPVSPSRNVP